MSGKVPGLPQCCGWGPLSPSVLGPAACTTTCTAIHLSPFVEIRRIHLRVDAEMNVASAQIRVGDRRGPDSHCKPREAHIVR